MHTLKSIAGRRIRFGLVGCGRISKNHVEALKKHDNHAEIVAVCDIDPKVFCGPSMVFTNVYNPRSAFPRKQDYRPTLVKRGATLGANCTVVCGVTIGRHAFVGAGAVVNRNVPDFALMLGVPARHQGWMTRFGERLPFPLSGGSEAMCRHTGERYVLNGAACHIDGEQA